MASPNPARLLQHRQSVASPAPSTGSVDSSSTKRHKHDKVTLDQVSWPPSINELKNYEDLPLDRLPKPYKRDDHDRVFCNRNLRLSDMKYFGFDMDYTLAIYKSPAIDELAYDLAMDRLVAVGYPVEIKQYKFDPTFPIRGLFLDKTYGNLIKVDSFGNILLCVHGRNVMSDAEIDKVYPNRYISPSEVEKERYYVLNTLFNIPETVVIADLITFFDNHKEFKRTQDGTGVRRDSQMLSYYSIYTDIRAAIDYVHGDGGKLKDVIIANLDKYVEKEERMPILLSRMHENGCRVFLATNSDYAFTQKIMTYLLDVPLPPGMVKKDWKEYFDLIVVSARKPTFFEEGTVLREVDLNTGRLKIGEFRGNDVKGRVLAGGSANHVTELLGARGADILYVGDHIFGDVLKSKKLRAWRTLLVVPELGRELTVCRTNQPHVEHLKNLEFMLAEVFRGIDSKDSICPDVGQLTKEIEETSKKIDNNHNPYFGSLFRSGMRQTFFAMQTKRYADLYAPSYINLINYPFCYEYLCDDQMLPHEEVSVLPKDESSQPVVC